MQTTSHILMVRPRHFAYNEQTAGSNVFQSRGPESGDEILGRSLEEFEGLCHVLREAGLDLHVIDDRPEPPTPDSIFPNNWVSFHEDGSVYLYPMMAENRRLERRAELTDLLRRKGFRVDQVHDLSPFEEIGRYLEGTGSMVLDRIHRLAYACLSPRTDPKVLDYFCSLAGYQPKTFSAVDARETPIYHTNVMMCIGISLAVVCAEAIPDPSERIHILNSLQESGRELLLIDFAQMHAFAGNMLELKNGSGEALMLMSEQAYQSLQEAQRQQIERHCRILHHPIPTIEKNGGGSVRCMIAEIHLPC